MTESMAIARLLDTLDALGFIARHLHPPRLDALVATLGDRDAALRAALADVAWPPQLRDHIEPAAEATLRACDGLRAAVGSPDGLRLAFRAMRQVSRALEALYPLAAVMPTVSRCFLASDDLTVGPKRSDAPSGVMHFRKRHK
jgi:phospholipase/carboxylesterase